ncbi:MAG: bifunctional diaminohydroxyphosphoribosylaminopyrimidine deaminase/5-amino-6-(5-phosphoribosylamino)uracil reductase RibD [Vicinamibacteraceae bacterium]|nr:bifunctional diaminohydroxyphosphoribosylaminopyrimidine deaminase/5-amino-6-(5-phosphoribosylamino)uracil reductase RibD [Vicinamibacteraceae bacterium]
MVMLADPDRDREFMRRALIHAARGRGRTSPNPMVGALVVDRDGVVVATGHHERAGEPHAEIHALRAAGDRARGATLYCTLEPCSHQGRTPPCAEAVVAAGIARAVVATRDPNPVVSGRGLLYLATHGVEVVVGVRADEAAALNRAFFHAVTEARPLVIAKIALSAEAAVAGAGGRPVALTSMPANRHVHVVRAEIDALAVGIGTVLADDPRLTCRLTYRERPLTRIVFDRRLRMPAHAALLATREAGPIVVAAATEQCAAAPDRVRALEDAGAEVWPVGDAPREVVAALHAREHRLLLVEGGPRLHDAFWRAGLVDVVQQYLTPVALGAGALPWAQPPGRFMPPARVVPLGPDVLVETHVHRTH